MTAAAALVMMVLRLLFHGRCNTWGKAESVLTATWIFADSRTGPARSDMRSALRHFLLAPLSRTLDRPPTAAAALRWLGKASLPVSDVGTPKHARAALDAITVLQDGRAASATTIARKRSVFAKRAPLRR